MKPIRYRKHLLPKREMQKLRNIKKGEIKVGKFIKMGAEHVLSKLSAHL